VGRPGYMPVRSVAARTTDRTSSMSGRSSPVPHGVGQRDADQQGRSPGEEAVQRDRELIGRWVGTGRKEAFGRQDVAPGRHAQLRGFAFCLRVFNEPELSAHGDVIAADKA